MKSFARTFQRGRGLDPSEKRISAEKRIGFEGDWSRVTKSLCRVVAELSRRTDLTTVGGKPDAWVWSRLRSWLEEQFGRKLPERFPTSRFL